MSDNLFDVFARRFPADASAPFLHLGDNEALSYSDMRDQSGQIATFIQSLGLAPGDRVAVQVEKSATALMLYLACLRAGVTYLPLNTAYTGDELDYFLADAAPALIVCDPSRETDTAARAKVAQVQHVLTLDGSGYGSLRDEASTALPMSGAHSAAATDPAAILYSSGTTGKPKGAVMSHGALASNAEALRTVWQFTPNDVVLHALPVFHTHGLFVATNTVLMNGTSMIFHEHFSPEDVIADLPRATVFMGVPTYYTRLLSANSLSREVCASIRLFISGSAPLLDETFRAFSARTGHVIVERYGMTESGIITSADPDKPRHAGTVGWPLKGVALRIADEADSPVAPGETGGVQITSDGLFSGYWNNPAKTAAEYTEDGFFRTGDLGFVDESGQLTLIGRAKDMFISGGFNVFPKEIEQVIDALDGVIESAVVGMPHPDFGEAGLAVVVAESDALDTSGLRETLKQVLANYKVPKLVTLADELPRNAMGKVQKNVLRDSYRTAWDAFLSRQSLRR